MRGVFSVAAPVLVFTAIQAAPFDPYVKYQAARVAAISLAVLGVSLLLPARLINFGQGLAVVLGGYATAWALNAVGTRDVVLGALSGAAMGAAVYAAIGPVVARLRGTVFALFTISISMMVYGAMVSPGAQPITGGSDGIYVPAPSQHATYIAAAVLLGLATYLRLRIPRTSIGVVISGIGMNELRIKALGADPTTPIYALFIVSGALGGLGGALLAMLTSHVSPQYAYWAPSSELAIAALLGSMLTRGPASVYDFLIGATVLEVAYTVAYMLGAKLALALGAVLIAILIVWRIAGRGWRY